MLLTNIDTVFVLFGAVSLVAFIGMAIREEAKHAYKVHHLVK